MKVKKYANVLYHHHFLKIGGCEQYEYEIIYKCSKTHDLDLFYSECDSEEQLDRIKKIIGEEHVHKYEGEQVYCNTLFINYDMGEFIDNVTADKYKNVIHANFDLQRNLELHDNDKITERLGVSNVVSKAYTKRFKKKCTTCYSPISIREHDKDRVLNLISATRLSEEKGKDRMKQLMGVLDRKGIKYYWHIYTNDKNAINNPNVIIHEPTLDIRPYIANADYCIQLSDTEGYCYTILESLCLGTPVIVTDLEVFREMGVENGVNGFLLPLDMSEIPVDEIYAFNKKFQYKPKEDDYKKHLYKGKTTEIDVKTCDVVVIKPYYDRREKVHFVPAFEYARIKTSVKDGRPNKPVGTRYTTDVKRAKVLHELGYIAYAEE